MQSTLLKISGLLLGLSTLAACAGPSQPPKELIDARLALQDAKSGNADRLETRTYDTAAAKLDLANRSWERDHDAATVLHQARLAEAEARKAQYAAEGQTAEGTLRRENERKTHHAIALRDAELALLRTRGHEAELERLKALTKEKEQALLETKEQLVTEQARAEREATRLREEQEKLAVVTAEQARAEREATRLREEQEQLAVVTAEQARAEREEARALEDQHTLEALEAERIRAEQAERELIRLRAEKANVAALATEQGRTEQAERELARIRAERDKSREDLTATLSRLAQVREETRGVIITLPGNVFFNVNRADVKPAMQIQLQKIAKALAAVPEQHLVIEGHTDSDGKREHNLSLSELRAQSVQKILVDGGIAGERMEIKGYGSHRPIADNSTPAGKAQNRRVEILLTPTKP